MAVITCRGCGVQVEARRNDQIWCPTCKVEQAKLRSGKYERGNTGLCVDCGAAIGRRAKRCKACSNKVGGFKRRNENNGFWRGGRTASNGYVYVRTGVVRSGAGAYRSLHHVVWEEAHGRPLPKGWVVHHLNGVKNDNRPENLLGLPRHEHHTHPREALRPYEARIRALEDELRTLRGD